MAWQRCAAAGLALAVLAAAALASAADRPGKVAYSNGASGGKLKWIGAAGEPAAPAPSKPAGPVLVQPVQHTDADAKPQKSGRPSLTSRASDSNGEDAKGGLQPFTKEPASSGPKLRAAPADSDNGAINLGAAGNQKVEGCVKLDSFGPINPNILDKVAPEPGKFPPNCPMTRAEDHRRDWAPTEFHWTASALCAKPAYFTDVHLERYGHTSSPLFQPLVSAGHFFLSVPALPYAMGLYPPNECIYTLGYYRPGSCAPHYLDPLPLSVRAAVFEAGAVVGLAAFVPETVGREGNE